MSIVTDIVAEYCSEKARSRAKRLDAQAELWMWAGYLLDELTIYCFTFEPDRDFIAPTGYRIP